MFDDEQSFCIPFSLNIAAKIEIFFRYCYYYGIFFQMLCF